MDAIRKELETAGTAISVAISEYERQGERAELCAERDRLARDLDWVRGDRNRIEKLARERACRAGRNYLMYQETRAERDRLASDVEWHRRELDDAREDAAHERNEAETLRDEVARLRVQLADVPTTAPALVPLDSEPLTFRAQVIDRDGDVWHRAHHGKNAGMWSYIGEYGTAINSHRTWGNLLDQYGPLYAVPRPAAAGSKPVPFQPKPQPPKVGERVRNTEPPGISAYYPGRVGTVVKITAGVPFPFYVEYADGKTVPHRLDRLEPYSPRPTDPPESWPAGTTVVDRFGSTWTHGDGDNWTLSLLPRHPESYSRIATMVGPLSAPTFPTDA